MNLRLIREPSSEGCTLSSLYLDGTWECWMLEDVVREVSGQPVGTWKVPGKTAIPSGQYKVELTLSPRFNRVLPELLSVPGFTGVRIHPGNVAEDTEGCLLPGSGRGPGRVTGSRVAFDRLFAKLNAVTAPRWLTIENHVPPPAPAAKNDINGGPIDDST